MKTFLLITYVFASILTSAGSVVKLKVRLDKVSIFGLNDNEETLKAIDVLQYGLQQRFSMQPISFSIQSIEKSGKIVLDNTAEPLTESYYSISGTIYYADDITFSFEIHSQGSREPEFVEEVYASRENSLSGFSRLVDAIYLRIKLLEKGNSKSVVRYGFVAEHISRGKGSIDSSEVSNALYAFSDKISQNNKARFVPWDSTRGYSFNSLKPVNVMEALNLSFLITAEFQKGKDLVMIKPQLFIRDREKGAPLNEINIHEEPTGAEYGMSLSDLLDVVNYLVQTNGVSIDNYLFLQDFTVSTPKEMADLALKNLDDSNYFKAAFIIRKSLTAFPNEANSLYVLAKIREKQGRLNESILNLERASKIEPNQLRKAYYLASAGKILDSIKMHLEASGKYIEAFQLDPQLNDPTIGEINYLAGVSLAKGKSFAKAIEFLEKSKSIKPLDPDIKWPVSSYYWLGYAAYFSNNAARAAENFGYVSLNGKDIFPDNAKYLSDALLSDARRKYLNSRYDEARKLITESIAINESEVGYQLLLLIMNRMPDFRDARKLIDEKIEVNILKVNVLKRQGQDFRTLFYKAKLDSAFGRESIYYFTKFLATNDKDSGSTWELGNVYASMNKNDSAILFLDKAIILGYKSIGVYLDLSETYIKSGNASKVAPLLDAAPIVDKRLASNKRNYILKLYFTVLAKRITKVDYGQEIGELEEYFSTKKAILNWDFGAMKAWIPNSGYPEEDKAFFATLTERMIHIAYN